MPAPSEEKASQRSAPPRPARKPPKKSEVTRARILDAAAFMFRRKGYALTRLSDIAKKARTQTSSIYYYFESREAIVAEVLEIANQRTATFVLNALAELPDGASVRDRITAAIRGHFAVALSEDEYISAHMRIFDQIPAKLREHFLRVLDENAQVWRALFQEAKVAGEIREDLDLSVLRLLLLGMMNWSIEWYKPGRLTPDEIARQAAIMLFEGIGPAASAASQSASVPKPSKKRAPKAIENAGPRVRAL
jgi:AcrR family transcriptional regulator